MRERLCEYNREESRRLEDLPEEVRKLFGREQEIALILYTLGSATAKEVEQRLSTPISNAAVRSMLERLVVKQILMRFATGERGPYVYVPAMTKVASAERALKQFATDYFGGSLGSAAHGMIDVLRKSNHSHTIGDGVDCSHDAAKAD